MTQDNAPSKDRNWIEHHLMVKELMTSTGEFSPDHTVIYNGDMREDALTLAMGVVDHEVPDGEDTSMGYTIVFGPRAYSMTRKWDWSTGHFSHVEDSVLSKAGMKIEMAAWNSPIIVDPDIEYCYVGFVDSRGDQHFCRMRGCWQGDSE